ncbi:MAG: diguanylate cyclase [Gemmatimonadetes bacterium]|nr:diguanylate cyclase [Gemmatimonadota bacterium]
MPRPQTPLADTLQALWESRAGDALRRVGLRSVRTTILTLAVLATLIPSLATGWISYRQNRRAIQAKLDQQLTGSSTQSAREVGLWLNERLNDLKTFASSYEVTENIGGGAGSRHLPDFLNSVNRRFPDFEDLFVVTPDQRTVAFTGRSPGKLHLPGDWLQKAREGEPVLGDPQRLDSATAVTMEVAIPIQNAAGRFLGVLAARLNFKSIEQPVRDLRAGSDGRIVVVRPDGQLIVHIGGRSTPFPVASLRQLEQADGAAVSYTATDGVTVLGALAQVPGADWMTVAEIPAATAYADIRHLRNTTVFTVLALLLIVGSLAYGLGLLVVLPLERLSRAADQVAGGDLDVAVPVSGGGEVSQLTGVFNDMVRRLREGREELERLSVTDGLTGLPNRRHLDGELERELQRHERHKRALAVLMLDVDRFKNLNDTYGHPAGDAVLRKLARILEENTRKGDTVARFGGEEFMVILPETPAAGALHLAEKIRAAIEEHRFVIGGDSTTVPVTASIGLARFPEHGTTPETLVMVADEALYRSKQGGRNRVTTAD